MNQLQDKRHKSKPSKIFSYTSGKIVWHTEREERDQIEILTKNCKSRVQNTYELLLTLWKSLPFQRFPAENVCKQ